MSLTIEQNEQINQIRNQLTNMLTVINNIARSTGVGPSPREGETDIPPPSVLYTQLTEPPVFYSTGEAAAAAEVVAPPPPFLQQVEQAKMHPDAGPPPTSTPFVPTR